MTRRRLNPEERALWRRAVRDVKPYGHPHERDVERASGSKPAVTLTRKGAPLPGVKQTRSRRTIQPADLFAAGDPRADRRVRRGRTSIDAALDLHGHSQSSARAALYGFILEARARGHGCVLIITGKGAPPHHASGRGVLWTRFQEWLCEEDFRQHIIRASPAHPRHGGGGAFYVFLKKRR